MIDRYQEIIAVEYQTGKSNGDSIDAIMHRITSQIPVHILPVEGKVVVAQTILTTLSLEDRKNLAMQLLQEQVIEQREKLNYWSTITAQSSQIDTGYIAQHLASLQTQIAGQGMRGKGDDLCDGSEVKSANFLDSLDKKGATAPRWNFTAVTRHIMERFLDYPAVYLLSMDLNPSGGFRTRIWKVDVRKHTILRSRYIEWMQKLGYPKFEANAEQSVNFQLFPPHSGTEENFARHGNGRANGFSKLQIPLEDGEGSKLIFRADEINGQIVISQF
ncbi:MamI family restriction endonuclease [Enterocloster bolteae]|uniref:MamI family restriction endonuclease n=1 Tax=Enterocloster bolteae TaxID=208479 RepID=UPI002A8101B6|nr:MamI family restriction endonuclease [Enterocloster bolteae]